MNRFHLTREPSVRKAVFSQDDVVAAGLGLVRREGLEQLTARAVALELGASTAPVYSNFATMGELAEAVKRSAVRELLGLMRRRYSGDAFLDLGIGVLTFVWDWPRLYAALFLAPPEGYDPGADLMTELTAAMAGMPELEPLPLAERIVVLKKVSIFTHGLATEICQGCSRHCTLESLVLMLEEVGRALLADARAGHGRSAAETALLSELWRVPGAPSPEPEKDPE